MRVPYANSRSMMVGALVLAMSALLFASMPSAQAASELKAVPINLEKTRLYLDRETRRTFLTVQNEGEVPVMMLASVFTPDAEKGIGGRSSALLVTPPQTIVPAGRSVTLKTVLLDKDLPLDRESLQYLRLKFIPAEKIDVKKQSVLSSMFTVYVKVFSRPPAVAREHAVRETCGRLTGERDATGVWLRNPTPYWMTLPLVSVNGVEIPHGDRSPMIQPFDRLRLADDAREVSFQCVMENGHTTDDVIRRIP